MSSSAKRGAYRAVPLDSDLSSVSLLEHGNVNAFPIVASATAVPSTACRVKQALTLLAVMGGILVVGMVVGSHYSYKCPMMGRGGVDGNLGHETMEHDDSFSYYRTSRSGSGNHPEMAVTFPSDGKDRASKKGETRSQGSEEGGTAITMDTEAQDVERSHLRSNTAQHYTLGAKSKSSVSGSKQSSSFSTSSSSKSRSSFSSSKKSSSWSSSSSSKSKSSSDSGSKKSSSWSLSSSSKSKGSKKSSSWSTSSSSKSRSSSDSGSKKSSWESSSSSNSGSKRSSSLSASSSSKSRNSSVSGSKKSSWESSSSSSSKDAAKQGVAKATTDEETVELKMVEELENNAEGNTAVDRLEDKNGD